MKREHLNEPNKKKNSSEILPLKFIKNDCKQNTPGKHFCVTLTRDESEFSSGLVEDGFFHGSQG